MLNNSPKISVILPSYNRGRFIDRSIKSILSQTYQYYEIIIVDDGSTDNTEEIIRNVNDSRIKYVRHQHNKGGSAARNTGLKHVEGEYIAFQDSDDEWLPEKLEKQLKVFNNSSEHLGIVYTDMWRISRGKSNYLASPHFTPEDRIIYNRALSYEVLNIGIQTALIRKEVFEKVGVFDERLPRFIDFEFFIRMSKSFLFFHINEPLVNFYDADMGISSNNKALVEARILILDKYFRDIKLNKHVLAKHYAGISSALCSNGIFSEEELYLNRALSLFKDNWIYSEKFRERDIITGPYIARSIQVISNGDLKSGRNCLIRAFKINPINIKILFALIASLFGRNIFLILVKTYLRPKTHLS